MCQWILKANGHVVPCGTVCPLTEDEKHNPIVLKHQTAFDGLIERRWGSLIKPPKSENAKGKDMEWELYEDEEQTASQTLDIEDIVDAKGKIFNQEPVWDRMLRAEIAINRETPGAMVQSKGVAKRHAVTPTGKSMGAYDNNALPNTVVYEVEFGRMGKSPGCH